MLGTIIMIALSIAPAPSPVFADYVFNVPVRIENMTHLVRAQVNCSVVHQEAGGTPVSLGEATSGSTAVPLVGGGFDGTVSVTVVVTATRLARYTPTRWGCVLVYVWRNPDGTTFSESLYSGERSAVYTRITGQEITTVTETVTGTFPPA